MYVTDVNFYTIAIKMKCVAFIVPLVGCQKVFRYFTVNGENLF